MIRVVYIVQSAGGVERYIQMFLKYIDSSVISNILICSNDYHKEQYIPYVEAFENIEMSREINLKKDIHAILKIRKLLKKYNPDIVYCHSSKAGAIGRIANIGLFKTIIYNPHGWAFNMRCSMKKRLFYKWVEKILAMITDKIIVISDYEKESATKNKICKPEKLKVIFNGIETTKYENQSVSLNKDKLCIPEDSYIIGMVGRISKQKAPDIFVRAAQMIKKKIPNSFFLIVGDGEDRRDIEKEIMACKLDEYIKITGWVDNPFDYIQLFDQAMLLSRWEGFGLALAEYMLAEKPIIATNVDAIPNLIENNYNGLLVNVNDVDDIVKASYKIYSDHEFSSMLAKNGKKVVKEKFNIERVVKEHVRIFKVLSI